VKVFFVRHGEGLDDIYNEYGGWSDRELAPKGTKVAFELSKKLKQECIDFKLVLTSPLKRAHQTAQIISENLECRLEDCAYLKERNTYGLLSGVNKEIAQKEYPKLVEAYDNGEFIPGGEKYSDFKLRVKALLNYLRSLNEAQIICVTHGYLMTTIMEEYLGVYRDRIQDGSMLIVDISKEDIVLDRVEGITYVKDAEKLSNRNDLKKFKS
jgi:broad specificity phosphatase PhoE